ncbi:MAG: hypothetical protein LBU65_16615 [Planctomycetaceae bacterium]|jgi:hypothetical protein|nr:hypothetical protein [Planctomycetaceae bacterium]
MRITVLSIVPLFILVTFVIDTRINEIVLAEDLHKDARFVRKLRDKKDSRLAQARNSVFPGDSNKLRQLPNKSIGSDAVKESTTQSNFITILSDEKIKTVQNINKYLKEMEIVDGDIQQTDDKDNSTKIFLYENNNLNVFDTTGILKKITDEINYPIMLGQSTFLQPTFLIESRQNSFTLRKCVDTLESAFNICCSTQRYDDAVLILEKITNLVEKIEVCDYCSFA